MTNTPQELVARLLRRNARDGALLAELWDALGTAPPLRPPVEPPPVEPPPVRPPDPPPSTGFLDVPVRIGDVFELRGMEHRDTVPMKSGDSADSLVIKRSDMPYTLADTLVLGSTRSGFKTPSGSDHITDVLVASCELTSSHPLPPNGTGTQWLARCFGIDDWEIKRCWFHDSNHKNEGHGFYGNVTGPLTIRDCLFENLGGNAIQLAFNYGKREHEGPPTKGGPILLENIAIRNVSWNPARGSFAIAVYGGDSEKHDFVLRGLDLSLTWDEHQVRSGRTCFSSGGINLRGYSKDSWDIGDVLIENCYVGMNTPFQPLAQLGSCRSLTVRNCQFYGGKVEIDHEHDDKKPCGAVSWSGNTGDAVVRNQKGEWKPVTEDWGS